VLEGVLSLEIDGEETAAPTRPGTRRATGARPPTCRCRRA
jgi:hypothetical protein